MLRRNIDISKGLLNGTIGITEKLIETLISTVMHAKLKSN